MPVPSNVCTPYAPSATSVVHHVYRRNSTVCRAVHEVAFFLPQSGHAFPVTVLGGHHAEQSSQAQPAVLLELLGRTGQILEH